MPDLAGATDAGQVEFVSPGWRELQRRDPGRSRVRIAFDAIAKTMPLGSVGYENAVNEKGECLIWLERRMLDKLNSYRRAGESYSDVILGVVEAEVGA